jgi:hypothetical protein
MEFELIDGEHCPTRVLFDAQEDANTIANILIASSEDSKTVRDLLDLFYDHETLLGRVNPDAGPFTRYVQSASRFKLAMQALVGSRLVLIRVKNGKSFAVTAVFSTPNAVRDLYYTRLTNPDLMAGSSTFSKIEVNFIKHVRDEISDKIKKYWAERCDA